jgi:hypothetical protein
VLDLGWQEVLLIAVLLVLLVAPVLVRAGISSMWKK